MLCYAAMLCYEARAAALQAALREASSNSRSLQITLFITGAKPKDIEPKADAIAQHSMP